ncbi:MAG: hypothetical protein J6U54_01140 [Clostridiales bacterium]|nr:hypothetical protein [Clostridiales bacterium]
MDKLVSICGIILTQFLFLVTDIGSMVALYVAATDKDISCLIVCVLCRVAKRCLIPMWYHEKIIYEEAFGDGEGND